MNYIYIIFSIVILSIVSLVVYFMLKKKKKSTCTKNCKGKATCADDGCGGLCNEKCNDEYHKCKDGKCIICTPDCKGKNPCSDDGCGGVCNEKCNDEYHKCKDGKCVCTPDCTGKATCTDDGCGGVCNENCKKGNQFCEKGQCGCNSTCTIGKCEDDGCGGICSSNCLDSYHSCSDNVCVCTPDCSSKGKECGNDGCGGSCGVCKEGSSCSSLGKCVKNECPKDANCISGKCCDKNNNCCIGNCTGKCGGESDGCCGTCNDICPPCHGCNADSPCSKACSGQCGKCPTGYYNTFCTPQGTCKGTCPYILGPDPPLITPKSIDDFNSGYLSCELKGKKFYLNLHIDSSYKVPIASPTKGVTWNYNSNKNTIFQNSSLYLTTKNECEKSECFDALFSTSDNTSEDVKFVITTDSQSLPGKNLLIFSVEAKAYLILDERDILTSPCYQGGNDNIGYFLSYTTDLTGQFSATRWSLE
jgi:hypothetical protein